LRRHSFEFTLEISLVLVVWILLAYGNAIRVGPMELGKMIDQVKQLLVWQAILLSAVTVWPSRNRMAWLAARIGMRITNGISNRTLAVVVFLYSSVVALAGILLSHLTVMRLLRLTFGHVSSNVAISISWSIPFLFLKSLVHVGVTYLAGDKIRRQVLSAARSNANHLKSSGWEGEEQEKTRIFRSKVRIVLVLVGISVGYLLILLATSDYFLRQVY